MEAMFHAYFEEAKDLSKDAELVACAGLVGLDEASVRDMLASGEYRTHVLEADRAAKKAYRVSGVPFFIVESNTGGTAVSFSGAQVQCV
jgi:predicted DsbA family dithiol-disulfide isomerase